MQHNTIQVAVNEVASDKQHVRGALSRAANNRGMVQQQQPLDEINLDHRI